MKSKVSNTPSPSKQTAFRCYLSRVYLIRRKKNSAYSLRAFARSLSLDPTLLSRLLKGERSFTKKMISRLCRETRVPIHQATRFMGDQGLSLPEARSKAVVLSAAQFGPLSQWYFFAILELFLLPDFHGTSSEIGRALGLSVTEVNAAIAVLIDQGLLGKSTEGKLCALTNSTTWTSQMTTTRDRKNYQKQILEKAAEAIDRVDFSQRETASLTLAASSKIIPEVKKRIQEFKNELRDLVESYGDYDGVYQLSLAYFPLTDSKSNLKRSP